MNDQEPDWKQIAMEIWNSYDDVALFLEAYMNQKEGIEFPFLKKNLNNRFKYFRFYRSRIMTISEYEEIKGKEKLETEMLYKHMTKTL